MALIKPIDLTANVIASYECEKYRNYMRSNGKEKEILTREKKTSSIDQSGPLDGFIQGHVSLS